MDIINSVEMLAEEHSKTRRGMGVCDPITLELHVYCSVQSRNLHHLEIAMRVLRIWKLCVNLETMH